MRNITENCIEESSGNVFKDLGFANPEEEVRKVELAHKLNTIIEKKGFTQKQAASLLGITQPQVSDLGRGRLKRFSVDKLITLLEKIGCRVDIKVIEHPRRFSQGRHEQLAL